jgi:hypothetical protein
VRQCCSYVKAGLAFSVLKTTRTKCDPAVPCELRVALEAIDRPDLGEQLRGRDGCATGQLERRWRKLGCALLELLVELGDRAVRPAAVRHQFTCEPHLQLLLLSREPAADAFQVRSPAEHPQRYDKGRVERVQVPAQPLLRPAARVDQIVAMVNKQLQIAKDLLVEPWPAQVRFPQRGSRDRERIDRV